MNTTKVLLSGSLLCAIVIPQSARAQSLAVSSVAGPPGAEREFVVSLVTNGAPIAAAQLDVSFDRANTPIKALTGGLPDCEVNDSLGKEGSHVQLLPRGCVGSECTSVRGMIYSTSNIDPILSGSWLFKCTIAIESGVPPGTYPLLGSLPIASDSLGGKVTVAKVDGTVQVSSPGPGPGCS